MFANKKPGILFSALLHIIAWAVVLFVPLLSENKISIQMLYGGPWMPILFSIIIFYINFFLLIRRYFINKKYVLFLFSNILLFTCFLLLLHVIREHDFMPPFPMDAPPSPGRRPMENPFMTFLFKDIITFAIPLVFGISIRVMQKLTHTETEKQEIEKENIQSTLMLLKYQLHPHFFFNSLNNIYSLIESEPQKAQKALYDLGKLMRYLLYEKELVSLRHETEFLKKYIALMELRLNENVKTTITFPVDTEGYKIAPLLFIPLIENAFKHGISSTETSIIIMEMQIKEGHLYFFIENSNFAKKEADISGSGIGLKNLKQRLNLLYPGKHKFFQSNEGGLFRVDLILEITKCEEESFIVINGHS